MGSFSIGLTGLQVAQQMMELVSSNIANATTEGYHRQEAVVRPIVMKSYGNVGIGGAEITEVKRSINSLLELEITRQQASLSQSSEELDVLRTVEAAFGEIGGDGLGGAIDHFFNSMTELAADPKNEAMRVQAVWAGDALAGEFRNIGRFLDDVETQVQKQAEGFITDFNNLSAEVHDLTSEMSALAVRGGSSNILADRRDQAVREMAELGSVQVSGDGDALAEDLRISAWGTPVVSRSSLMELEVSLVSDGMLGVGAEGSGVYQTDARGGKIGAMLSMSNEVLSDIRSDLDALANQVMSAVNSLHVQGLGAGGSFTELSGTPSSDLALSEWDPPVTNGSLYVRMTNTTTNAITRTKIDIDTADTLTDVATLLDGVGGLSASVVDTALKFDADPGYTFDFIPELMSSPYTSAITGTASPTIAGIYTGQTNQVYTATVVGTGQVGIASNLQIEVRNGDSQLVETLNVGQGYAAGDVFDVGSGITVALGAGQLNDGDEFTIQALADTDTSDFLNSAGINTFFSGTSAATMATREDILADPGGRFAVSRGASLVDSGNIGLMIAISEDDHAALQGTNVRDYYRGLVTGVGQAVMVREARTSGLDNVMTQLQSQRDEISAVDLNEEIAKLISLERMFQGMARVISTQDQMIGELMDLL